MLPGGLSVGMRPSLGGAAGGGRDALLRAAERAVGEPILSAASEAKTGRQNWGHRRSLPPPAAPPMASHAVGQAARQHGASTSLGSLRSSVWFAQFSWSVSL